jgi:hypothetical protein
MLFRHGNWGFLDAFSGYEYHTRPNGFASVKAAFWLFYFPKKISERKLASNLEIEEKGDARDRQKTTKSGRSHKRIWT